MPFRPSACLKSSHSRCLGPHPRRNFGLGQTRASSSSQQLVQQGKLLGLCVILGLDGRPPQHLLDHFIVGQRRLEPPRVEFVRFAVLWGMPRFGPNVIMRSKR